MHGHIGRAHRRQVEQLTGRVAYLEEQLLAVGTANRALREDNEALKLELALSKVGAPPAVKADPETGKALDQTVS